ncbi:unnamed protein product [Malus baccata var. baccata]
MPELFTLKINHGGKWSENAYTGGFEAWFDYVDKDFMSFFEIDEMVKKLGYDGFILYHYRIPGMSYKEGLRHVDRDQDKNDYVDDEHEAKATEGGQGNGDKAEDGPFNADNEYDEDDEGDEGEEGHKTE